MISSLRKKYAQFITSGALLVLLVIGAGSKSPKGWLVCLALMALISLFAWVSTMRRRRAITDMPTSRIASAAQGYVELIGVGRPPGGLPLLSRRTKQPCLWYRYLVMQKSGKYWTVVEDDESDTSFIVDDGSGCCMVDTEGAEITTRHTETWREGNRSYTEWKLLSGDTIYALGEFRTFGGGTVDLDARRDMGELLTEWKQDKKGLLERFDLDKNGEINETEWRLARQAARREVSKMHTEARNVSDVHTLRRPSDRRHYLISNIDPKRLARRYLLWSFFHLTCFLSVLGAIPYVLHQQTKHEAIKVEREAELQRRVQKLNEIVEKYQLPSSPP
ncbi:MAG: E3 ubiquitin ligase family protein [Zoogloeaceae bacterium]|jgi:hypothetical protein|nr:E3 ubiquitin ligase family protein [Zoogloeaceae bacterium]